MYQLQLLCRRFLAALALMMVLTAVDAPALGRSALAQVEEAAAPGFGPAVAGMIDPAAVSEPERAARFPDLLHAHVDVYWSDRFAESGRSYRPPAGVVGFTTTIDTGCGLADPETETAFYCILDETIYYSVEFRRIIDENIGDFGWVTVVAHEWGHHIQRQLGYDLVILPYQGGDIAPITLEQQADCLAGAYTDSAELSGWLDPGDLDEAMLVTGLSGDPPGTSVFDPSAHGTGSARVVAFIEGYELGFAGCGLDL
ncbi:MAG: neutral zinc metallopeptidase [Chloroflexia bacterium]|nr:neutral zinc metallopeptidase [Chloroflexia bacterium]